MLSGAQIDRRPHRKATMKRHSPRLAMVAALLWSGTGWGVSARAGGVVLTTPSGLHPGDQFRFVFVTDGTTTATSTDIGVYDNFVQSQAGGATYDGVVVNWLVIGSTETVNAINHIGATAAPVYLVDGTEVTPSTTQSGLWSGALNHAINEDITGGTITEFVWTGTSSDGTALGGAALGDVFTLAGATGATNGTWTEGPLESPATSLSVYGISQVLTVHQASVPEPSGLFMMVTALGAVLAIGWSRHRRDQRRQGSVVGPPDTPR
jgi:hypothetical protein